MRLVGLLVGHNPYRKAAYAPIPAENCLAVIRLVFVELRTIHKPGNHFVHVVAVGRAFPGSGSSRA